MKYKILLLEDDMMLSETVAEHLQKEGYEVVSVYDGESAIDILYEKSFDLLLLDVKVPALNGFEVLKEYREKKSGAPAIFITSLNSIEDLERGFGSGADDYIKKPFELKELSIRVKSLLKRGFLKKATQNIELKDGLIFDLESSMLKSGDKEIKIQDKEMRLLKIFLKKRGEVVTHEEIRNSLWDFDEEGSDESLRTYIKDLRKILGKDSVVSLKKVGYRFTL